VLIERLELVDFRNYREAVFTPSAGTTLVLGDNGHGKTNLVEAMAYLASLTSFRGAGPEALVRDKAERAVLRASVREDDGRRSVIEAELAAAGRSRVQVNRQRLSRARDLLGVVRVTVFSPDDLTLVKGPPAERRRYLDDTLVALAVKHDARRRELERIVRQRNVLLRQTGGRLDDDARRTLDVWDAKLVETGEQLGHARATLVARLEPLVAEAYAQLAGAPTVIGLSYDPTWRRIGLAAALAEARPIDLRQAVSTVGPHRDELVLSVGGMAARTHASQGEQRTLALSLRLAAHRLIADRTGSTPVLVLDDVLSELDAGRAAALLGNLPSGQIVITTAGAIPPAAEPQHTVRIENGTVRESARSGGAGMSQRSELITAAVQEGRVHQ
jgi:DNA replication and repair protein RecF